MEKTAVLGILLISVIGLASYFAVTSGFSGAAVSDYQVCCCSILTDNVFVHSQIQARASDCASACSYYEGRGHVFAREGYCGV